MYKIEIENIKIKTKIGVPNLERKKEQILLITLAFNYNISNKDMADDIRFLKDYSVIIKFLRKFIKGSRYKTLEKLLIETKKAINNKFKLNNIYLKIQKPAIAKKYDCESISVSK